MLDGEYTPLSFRSIGRSAFLAKCRRSVDDLTALRRSRSYIIFGTLLSNCETLLTHHLAFLVFPFDERIVNEGVEHAHQRVLVIPEQLHRHLTCDAKDAFDARHAQPVDHVLCQTEWDAFGDFERFALACAYA